MFGSAVDERVGICLKAVSGTHGDSRAGKMAGNSGVCTDVCRETSRVLLQAYEQLQSVLAGRQCVDQPAQRAPKEAAHKPRQPRSAPRDSRKGSQGTGNGAPPQAEDQSIRDVFNCVAKEHGTPGTIPVGEVATVLQMLGVQLDVSQQYEAVKQLDSKGTGKVTIQDFLAWVKG